MTETNDYEKAKQECQNECFEKFLKTAGWTKEQVTEEVNLTFNFIFDVVFKRAYQLGKAQLENRLVNGLVNERLQVAAMAMQGILASGEKISEVIISESVYLADALLTELNKGNNE